MGPSEAGVTVKRWRVFAAGVILQAVLSQDLYLVIGSLIYSSVLLVMGNLLADILLAVVDPRIRIG